MVDDIKIVRASFPKSAALYGRTYIHPYGKGYGVYEDIIVRDDTHGLKLLGMGRSEEEAWFSAAKAVQQMLLRRLER